MKTPVHLKIDQVHETYLTSSWASLYSGLLYVPALTETENIFVLFSLFILYQFNQILLMYVETKGKGFQYDGNIPVEKTRHAMLWGDRAKGSCYIGQANSGDKKFQCQWLNTTLVCFTCITDRCGLTCLLYFYQSHYVK